MNTYILSLVIASMALPVIALPPSTSFATRLLTEVQGLRLGKQIAISIELKKNTGSYLTVRDSLNLLDSYLDGPQSKELYGQVRTLLGANFEKFNNLLFIRQLEGLCKLLVVQQHEDSETIEEIDSLARGLFAQYPDLFDEAATQRLTQLSAEEKLLASLREEELAETEESGDILPDIINSIKKGRDDDIDTVSTIKSSQDFYRVSRRIARQLTKAVANNDTENITNILAKNGLSANIVIDKTDNTTLLQYAASKGKLPVVQHLIDILAADINIENKLHLTTLDAAVVAKQYDTADFLITRNAVSAGLKTQPTKWAPTLDKEPPALD